MTVFSSFQHELDFSPSLQALVRGFYSASSSKEWTESLKTANRARWGENQIDVQSKHFPLLFSALMKKKAQLFKLSYQGIDSWAAKVLPVFEYLSQTYQWQQANMLRGFKQVLIADQETFWMRRFIQWPEIFQCLLRAKASKQDQFFIYLKAIDESFGGYQHLEKLSVSKVKDTLTLLHQQRIWTPEEETLIHQFNRQYQEDFYQHRFHVQKEASCLYEWWQTFFQQQQLEQQLRWGGMHTLKSPKYRI